MTTNDEQYVPDEQDLEVAWIESEASADDINVASAEFDRFLARVRRDAQAEAWEAWASGLATHLDGATPRAWGFHHPCDPPGERWEPSVKDRTLMEVSDFLRDREANPNPYRTTEKESRHDD